MAPADATTALAQAARDGDRVVIVGAGLAGLFTALKLAPVPVTLISPAPLGEGTSSSWAQGGIAAAVSEGDTPEAHAQDTIRAGGGLADEKMARLLAEEAPARIEDLLWLGVPFDTDLQGKLQLSREAAHGARRIVRVKGDLAGKAIMAAVTAAVRRTDSIHLAEGVSVHELAIQDGRVTGVYALIGSRAPIFIPARAVVLATGGVGQLYEITTNPPGAAGHGLAMGARAGAVVADPEFVQFHPTALAIGRDPAPLATEALRGEGAVLINSRGERFMTGVHADAELAPRDVVARAVFRELRSGRGAFLDGRTAIGARFPDAFPGFYQTCQSAGLDPARQPIPIAPAAHYHMGGILTDANGRSSLDGLWACGEVAATGAHGANRLASNSLLETVVFGARIAEDIGGLMPSLYATAPAEPASAPEPLAAAEAVEETMRLRHIMTAHAGVSRTADGLKTALRDIDALASTCRGRTPVFANTALAARFIAAAALAREESRGAHFRADHPEPREAWRHHSYLTLAKVDAICQHAAAPETQSDNIIRTASGS